MPRFLKTRGRWNIDWGCDFSGIFSVNRSTQVSRFPASILSFASITFWFYAAFLFCIWGSGVVSRNGFKGHVKNLLNMSEALKVAPTSSREACRRDTKWSCVNWIITINFTVPLNFCDSTPIVFWPSINSIDLLQLTKAELILQCGLARLIWGWSYFPQDPGSDVPLQICESSWKRYRLRSSVCIFNVINIKVKRSLIEESNENAAHDHGG